MYETADNSRGGSYTTGWQPARLTGCEWGLTRNQDKYAWTSVFTLAGPDSGREITTTMAVSQYTNAGEPNTGGTAKLYRQIGALGAPVGEKFGGPAGSPGFWDLGWTGEQVAAFMVQQGVPVEVNITYDEKWENFKIKDIRAARAPAAPPQQAPAQQAPAQQAPAPAMGGYQPGPPAQGYGPPQQAPAPAQAPQGYPPQQAPQGPYGAPPGTFPGQVSPGPTAPAPGAPPMTPQGFPAPAGNPGQPGMGQFTPQGQAQQAPPQQAGPPQQAPYPAQPPNGAPPQGAQAPGQQAPPQAPWR
jgi:hypothetical protein